MAKGIWKKYQLTRSNLTKLVEEQLTELQKSIRGVQ